MTLEKIGKTQKKMNIPSKVKRILKSLDTWGWCLRWAEAMDECWVKLNTGPAQYVKFKRFERNWKRLMDLSSKKFNIKY
jgi:hypothetical protein